MASISDLGLCEGVHIPVRHTNSALMAFRRHLGRPPWKPLHTIGEMLMEVFHYLLAETRKWFS